MAAVVNPFVLGFPSVTFHQLLTDLSLTTNLIVCLDAGDSSCYDGTSQTWTDRVGSFNMFRGTTSGSEATDPTFNGVAGAATAAEYFSSDGDDLFKETAAHNYSDNWHKNNGVFSMIALYYIGTKSVVSRVWDNTGAAAGSDGVAWEITSSRKLQLRISKDNVGTIETLTSTAGLSADSWNFAGVSYNEADTSMVFAMNGTTETPGPLTSSATNAKASNIRIGARNDTPATDMESGERIAIFAAWSSKLTTTNFTDIYNALKTQRFTALP